MGPCGAVTKRLRQYVNSKLKGPSEIKIPRGREEELGVFLGYLAIRSSSNRINFYNFFYNERLNRVLRFKYTRGFDSNRYFFKKVIAKVVAGTLSIYPSVGTIIPRTHKFKLRVRPELFSGRIPLYIDHGLLRPLLCSAVIPISGLTTAALETRSGRITRAPFVVIAIRPHKVDFQGFSTVIKAGVATIEADSIYALGELTKGRCLVLAVDLARCDPKRRAYAISSYPCDFFSQAPLCTLWGFRRVEPQHVRSEIERLLSAGAEPNSLVPVVDKGCLGNISGSTRQRLLECANRADSEVILPTEDYVKTCGIERRTVETINVLRDNLNSCTIF